MSAFQAEFIAFGVGHDDPGDAGRLIVEHGRR
jgi:hypothetical protein